MVHKIMLIDSGLKFVFIIFYDFLIRETDMKEFLQNFWILKFRVIQKSHLAVPQNWRSETLLS